MKVLSYTPSNLNIYATAVVLTIAGIVFFSMKSIFIKIAYTYGSEPVSLMFLRMLMALPFYIGIYLYNRKSMHSMSSFEFIATVSTGIIGYYVASILDLQGLVYINASLERMILYLFPSFVLIFSVVFFAHQLKVREVLAFILSYSGILLIYQQDASIGGGVVTQGAMLVLGSAVAFAIFVLASGYLIKRVGAVQFTSISMLGASMAIGIHFGMDSQVTISGFPKEVYLYAFLLAVLCTVLPSYLINYGVKTIGAAQVAIMSTISPLITIGFASIFLQESYSVFHTYGFLLAIIGIGLITIKRSSDKRIT